MTQYNEKTYKLVSDNTKYDADGNAVILENDEWRDERKNGMKYLSRCRRNSKTP